MSEFIKKNIKNLLEEQRFAVIATQDERVPYTNLVTFLVDNNLKKIYFPTSKKSKKFKNIKNNSNISILFDNRGNKPEDINNAVTVTAIGSTCINKKEKIVFDFLKKHPYLKEFLNSKNCVMIEIDVSKYIFVDNFQNIKMLDLK